MYIRAAGRFQPGASPPAGAVLRNDPAQAMAGTCRAADTDRSCRTPFVFEIVDGLVGGEVRISRQMACRALELDARGGARS